MPGYGYCVPIGTKNEKLKAKWGEEKIILIAVMIAEKSTLL